MCCFKSKVTWKRQWQGINPRQQVLCGHYSAPNFHPCVKVADIQQLSWKVDAILHQGKDKLLLWGGMKDCVAEKTVKNPAVRYLSSVSHTIKRHPENGRNYTLENSAAIYHTFIDCYTASMYSTLGSVIKILDSVTSIIFKSYQFFTPLN